MPDKNTHKKNFEKPAPEELTRLSEHRHFFRAVSNYMANVLKIDRTAVDEMLEKKVEARNVDALVSKMVAKYFGFGPDANGLGYHVKKRIDETVDRYVRETMDKTCRGWIDREVQRKAEEIAGTGRAPADMSKAPRVPNLEIYQGAAYAGITLIQKLAGDWIAANMPDPEHVRYTVKVMPSADVPVCIDLYNLRSGETDLLNTLRENPGHYRPVSGSARIDAYGVKKLLAEYLIWDSVGRIVPDRDGLAVFPEEI